MSTQSNPELSAGQSKVDEQQIVAKFNSYKGELQVSVAIRARCRRLGRVRLSRTLSIQAIAKKVTEFNGEIEEHK